MKTKTISLALYLASISTAALVAMGLSNPAFSAPPSRASVSVILEGTGTGTVTSNPEGISCPSDCFQQYKTGTSVTFTATNSTDSTFSGWGDACADFGTSPSCVVQVSGSTSITAQFASAVRYPAPVPATGQTNCYDSSGYLIPCEETGQDGEYRSGVPWPVPRFTDNDDGTVTDMLTGLIWLKDANCLGAMNWQAALDSVKALAAGTCNLSDGSEVGQWRLPNVKELLSLMDYGHIHPALPENHPFDNAFPGKEYWTSTTLESPTSVSTSAYMVLTSEGWALPFNKNNFNFLLWPVRDKQ